MMGFAMEAMLWLLDKVFLAALVGVVGSGIFFLLLSRLKPKVQISDCIAKGKNTRGEDTYRIKVINRSSRSIADIRAELQVIRGSIEGQCVQRTEKIDLRRQDPMIIGAFSRDPENTDYAFRFITYKSLDQLLEDSSVTAFRFRIFCRDLMSGFGTLHSKTYLRDEKIIVPGDFRRGDTFEVIEVDSAQQGAAGDALPRTPELSRWVGAKRR